MKIACISTSLVPSVTANSIQVMKVCQAMQQLGHQVQLWVPGNSAVPFDQMKKLYGLESDFTVSWLASRKQLKRYDFALSAINAARNWKANLIYSWLPQAAWAGVRLLNIPSVLEMHDRASGKFGLFWLKSFMLSSRKKELAVVSHALKQALEKQLGFSIRDEEVIFAPNGVDLQRYQNLQSCESTRTALSLPQKLTAGYTGHFYAGRGVEILFKLAQAYPEVNFLWIGGREQELENVKKRLDAEHLENVILTGFMDNAKVPQYQAACEILLMPYERIIAGSSGGNSVDICSPMKMFEYMAAGRAIISSDLPVIREILDEQCAVFCPPEDADGWISSFGSLLQDPEKRKFLGDNARNKMSDLTIIKRQENILRFMMESNS